ncbi:MAG: DUF3267 domain-containing protein [Clostridia bacterium]|nr:DUF3267 domain-containing protein [Clostridia bacterium]
MKALNNLPTNYREIFSVNLQNDKKIAVVLNVVSLLIGAVMAVPMHFYIPITTLFDFSQGFLVYFIRFAVLLLSMIVYLILHEAVHGVAMKICGTKKVKYGFTGLYAFAGSDDFYDKKSYIFIALAPVVLWGIVLLVMNLFVPQNWFWVVYFIQIFNISGAAGDFYVTAKFSKMPDDILISDSGVGMKVYSAE